MNALICQEMAAGNRVFSKKLSCNELADLNDKKFISKSSFQFFLTKG
jgi:hypothetical protein